MNAYVTSHNVTVTGGVLDIDFVATVDQPSVAAIEVLGGADSTVPVPGGAAAVVPTGGTPTSGAAPQTVSGGAATGGMVSSRAQAPASSPFQAPAPSAPLTASSSGFAAPDGSTSTPQTGTGSSPFQAPSQPFAAPLSAPSPGTDPVAPVVGTAPQVRNTVQPRELWIGGEEGFVVRVDVLAAFLLLMLVLSTRMLRRSSLWQLLVAFFARLRPRTAN